MGDVRLVSFLAFAVAEVSADARFRDSEDGDFGGQAGGCEGEVYVACVEPVAFPENATAA